MEEYIIGFDNPEIRDLSIIKICKYYGKLYHPLIGKSESNLMGKGYCTPQCYLAALRVRKTQ